MARFSKEQVRACYQAYLQREGPTNLGTVEWPAAKPGCLKGMKFLTTGILETIEREDAVQLLSDCGGHVMSGMSKNLSYLIVGRDAGPVKLEKAEEWGIKQLSEEEFFNFIKDKTDNYDPSQDNEVEEKKPKKKTTKKDTKPEAPTQTSRTKKNVNVYEDVKKVVKKEKAVGKKRTNSQADVTVKEEKDIDMKSQKAATKKRGGRARACVNIDMSENGNVEDTAMANKRVKKESANEKTSKKGKSNLDVPLTSGQVTVKVEADDASLLTPQVEGRKPSRKKAAAGLKEKPITKVEEPEPAKRSRGRSKK